jgi:methionyl-tRNA formyltransferase
MTRKFAILAGADDPLFGHYLEAMEILGLVAEVIIVDLKALTLKDQAIFAERTLSRIVPKPPPDMASDFYHFVDNHNGEDALRIVRDSQADFLVSFGTPRILKHDLLVATPLGVLNCHPGLLPDFRGCSCVEWAIYLDKPVGVTVHRMTKGIDEGPVLLQHRLNITTEDSYEHVRIKTYLQSCLCMAEATLGLVSGRFNESDFIPQVGGQYFSPMDPDKLKTVKAKLATITARSF